MLTCLYPCFETKALARTLRPTYNQWVCPWYGRPDLVPEINDATPLCLCTRARVSNRIAHVSHGLWHRPLR